MDGGVQENAAGIFTKADGILHHRLRIQTRGLHQIGRADNPGIHLLLGVGIGGVVAAHEPQHEHKLRVALHGSLGLEALGDIHPQGLFGKDVLSCVQCRLDLPAVLRGGGDHRHGVYLRLCQHLVEIRVQGRHPQLPGIFQGLRPGGAGGCQPGAGDLTGDVLRVDPAQAAQPRDADAQGIHSVSSFTVKNRPPANRGPGVQSRHTVTDS